MPSYLLTCNCGNSLPVDVGQAGGQVVCSCGTRLEVPTLRNLRHLPAAPTIQPAASATWSARKGAIAVFLIGAIVLATASFWNWLREPKIPVFEPKAQADFVERSLNELTPLDAWKTWTHVYRPLAERGFTPLERNDTPMIRAEIARRRFLEMVLLSIAGVCVGLAAITAFWPSRKPKK